MNMPYTFTLCFLSLIFGISTSNVNGICDDATADIIFVLDATNNSFFYEMNRFLEHFTYNARENIFQNKTRFAAISFSTDSEMCFNFSKPYSNNTGPGSNADYTLASCIGILPVITRHWNATKANTKTQRNTAKAIKLARNQIQSNGRSGVQTLVILATDGLPQDYNETVNEARLLHLMNGVIMIVITTKQLSTVLFSITSNPLHFTYIDEANFTFNSDHQLLDLLCSRHLQRSKRRVNCRDESFTADPGRICVYLRWTTTRHPERYYFDGRPPNDCYPGGDTTLRIMKYGSLRVQCTFHVRVTVHYCSLLPSIVLNGQRLCTGVVHNVYGSVCSHYCNSGYSLNGAFEKTCNLIAGSAEWSNDDINFCQVQYCEALPFFPYGNRQCSMFAANVFPSVCTHTCNSDFTLHGASRIECVAHSSTVRWSSTFPVCHASIPPNLSTCRVFVTDIQGRDTISGYLGNDTFCNNQRDEWIKTKPHNLHFAVKADHNHNFSRPQGVTEVKSGVVGAIIKVIIVSLSGEETIMMQQILNSEDFCNENVSSTSPLFAGRILDCKGNLNLTSLNLNDGERLCADITAYSGGYYNLVDEHNTFQQQVIFEQIPKTKRVCFMYDKTKPVHCFARGCIAQPLELSSRTTRSPFIQVKVSGWEDPIPTNGPLSSASRISKYKLEIHEVDTGLNKLNVQDGGISDSTMEWNETSTSPYYVNMSLPEEEPRLYGVLLEVHDFAGNVRYARRLVLMDNSSFVDLNNTYFTRVTTADMGSNFEWQANHSSKICVDWHDRFYNTKMLYNNLLLPVRADSEREVYGHYDQVQGLLPINGTNNVHGIVRFELSWSGNEGTKFLLGELTPVEMQSACFQMNLTDGDRCAITIQAFDIMNNTKEDSVYVNIDQSNPIVTIQDVHRMIGHQELLINETEVSQVILSVQAMDHHSGIRTLQWVLGVKGRQGDEDHGMIEVYHLTKQINCAGRNNCYCPVLGPCELSEHQMKFAYHQEEINKHDDVSTHQYYLNITATNNAGLSSIEQLDIVLNMTSYSTIIILDGLFRVKEEENTGEDNHAGIIVGAVLGTITGCILIIVFICKLQAHRRFQKEASIQA